MTLLQQVLAYCKEAGNKIPDEVVWIVQDADGEIKFSSNKKPPQLMPDGIWRRQHHDKTFERRGIFVSQRAPDWDRVLQVTSLVRTLVDLVLDESDGWRVNIYPTATTVEGDVEWIGLADGEINRSRDILYLRENVPIYRYLSSKKETAKSAETTLTEHQKCCGENKYARPLTQRAIDNGYRVDAYDIDSMFPDSNTAVIHARKKLLALGLRSGGKSRRQDIKEAIWSLNEALKLED